MKIEIRQYKNSDLSKITEIWNGIIDEELYFPWCEHFSEGKAEYVLSKETAVFSAFANDSLVGFYLLHPNSSGKCSHVANAMYAVEKEYRRKGIGTKLIQHSLSEARKHGFHAMQYNSVVATNPSAQIYANLGFEKVGIVKDGFKLTENSYADLFIFYMIF